MARAVSITPAAGMEELRDGQSFPVVFFTQVGRNGTRRYQIMDRARIPIDLTSVTPKLVVKTSPDAADTELSASFPLTGTVFNPGQGLVDFNFSAVNFVNPVGQVLVIFYDGTGANPVILVQMMSSILKAGV